MIWNRLETVNMARIYFSCPFCSTNGNSLYSIGRWVIGALLFIVVLLTFLPTRRFFSSRSPTSGMSAISDTNYGIVIDCGSSGSRVYLYHWPPHSGNPNDLLEVQQLLDDKGEPVVRKVSPGLSSFEHNPNDASDHIKALLLFAQDYIPEEKRKETVLYVMATAGMRMLPDSAQKAILTDLQTDIKAEFDFIAPENHFEVISGKQEGVFAWIAINYALDRFSHSQETDDATVMVRQSSDASEIPHVRKRTVGMIDMGGGSVQIAFEVTDSDQIKELPASLLSEVNLGCQDSDKEHKYRVYVTTFLGYGANSALDRYHETLVKSAAVLERSGTAKEPLPDACSPKGMTQVATDKAGVSHHLVGTGSFPSCLEAVYPLLNKSVSCQKMPCSINGVHQPKVDLQNSFYGFSEFWYSTEDVFRMGGTYNYHKFKNKAEDFCSTNWSQLETWFNQKFYPKADDHRFRNQCFKAAWMVQVFHQGFDFPTSYAKLTSAQLVRQKDVGWTLGALISKTRFLPLRDIALQKELAASQAGDNSTWVKASRWLDTQFLFIICFLTVLMAIILYLKHLRMCPEKSALARVPSMSYFMTEQDQLEQGVRTVKGQGFIL